MNFSNARRNGVQLFIYAVSFSILYHLACSGSSEQTEMSESTTQELQAKIVYYALPGWPHCAKVTTIVNSLEKEFQGALQCEVLDALTAENKEKIKGYGFDNHGLVVFDAHDNIKKKMNGHLMREPEIRAALSEVMGDG